MRKRMKKGGACILVLATVLAILSPWNGRVYGADAIDTARKDCTITFLLEDSVIPEGSDGQTMGYDTYFDWMASQGTAGSGLPEINVNLYRVASVSSDGRYTALDPFAGGGAALDLSDINDRTTAEQWLEKADAAAAVVEAENSGAIPVKTQNILGADGSKISGLETGLYLVYVEKDQVKTEEYTYNFTPFLVSLPGNHYFDQEDQDSAQIPGDDWVYDVTVGLKPGREDRLGSLEISKTLEGYHEKLGKALFVFDITAVKDGQVVYSNVVSMTFDGTENAQKVTVEGIPAGSVATVTETYSGASYTGELTSASRDVLIVAREDGLSGTVAFANRYDGRINSGGGVTNHFEDIGENGIPNWVCTQIYVEEPASGGGDGQ